MDQESGSIYHRLEKNGGEIRLLLILAGKDSDPILCRLDVVSLHKHPLFEALSYVWDTPGEDEKIYVNDVEFGITANLYAILRQLKYRDRERTICVDQICINQCDVLERNHQVALMGEIYSRCYRAMIS